MANDKRVSAAKDISDEAIKSPPPGERMRTTCETRSGSPETPGKTERSESRGLNIRLNQGGGNRHSLLLSELTTQRALRQRTNGVLTLVLFDAVRFHDINEQYSPDGADRVLAHIEDVIVRTGEPGVHSARFAGDQFISLLCDVPIEHAVAFAEQCRRTLTEEPIIVDGQAIELMLSVGIAPSSPGCPETPHQLIQRARIALTHGKQGRGNRLVTWTQLLADPLADNPGTSGERMHTAHWMARLRQHVRSTHMESMRALVAATDARDAYTKTHSQTVAGIAERIGRGLDLRGARLEALTTAALLHDIGKIGVPDAILTKPGPLTPGEFDIVKRHPRTAVDILENMSFLGDTRPLILHHHERFDGGGYPAGLKGIEIPIGARIIAVADAIDTMLSPRTYKAAYSVDRVRVELRACAGKQFDPQVTSVALRLLDDAAGLLPPVTV